MMSAFRLFKKTITQSRELSLSKKALRPGPSLSRFRKFSKPEYFLALDIGSVAVKALVFRREDKKIVISGSSLEYFDRFGVFDSTSFETDVIKTAILKAISEARGQAKVETNSFFLGLPATIFKAKTFLQSFKREKESKIKEKEEKEIYQKILEETKKQILRVARIDSGLLPEDLQFDFKILDTKIDGYEVNRISGFNGRNLEFGILATFLPKHYLEDIKKIFKDLNLELLKISNLAENLPHLFESKKAQAIFLDIGGDLTQIFLVKEGRIFRISEFESGGRSFSRILSKNLGLTEKAAREMKENYSKRLFSEESRKKIKEILSPEIQKWFFNLKVMLKKEKFLLPSTIFLFGGGSLLPDLQEIFKKSDWTDLPFVSKPEVKVLLPKDLKNIEDKTHSLKSPQIIPSILICFS